MNTPRVREAGDSALLLELDEIIDERVNARAISIAASIREARLEGVRDVVPTYRSVAVHFDPLRVRFETVRDALDLATGSESAVEQGKIVEIPVGYGGEAGPDLTAVAEFAGVSPDRAAAMHADVPYRVYMLGFLPGFAYLGRVNEAIAMPRHATPRLKVPAGSVGIAGHQTGVYPRDSPGGWRIIGRTTMAMFDPTRAQPALLQAGDTVRFVPSDVVSGFSRTNTHSSGGSTKQGPPYITVLRPGLLTTIQDSGRWGQQASGVSVSGAMDRVSHRVANALVGNDASAATLEVTILGPEVRIDGDTRLAVVGGDFDVSLDQVRVPAHQPVACRRGAVLRFGERRSGARAYVAFSGGIAVAPTLGSRATHLPSGLGGAAGRAIQSGDELPLGDARQVGARRVADAPSSRVSGGVRLRVRPGPQDDFFTHDAFEVLQRTRFVVTPQSDRMGYRLRGGSLARGDAREMISDAAFMGALQVPPSGEPILLMADRPTTGGYPQIATVITADLPLAGQLAPGDWVEFRVCSRAEALSALIAQEGSLLAFE